MKKPSETLTGGSWENSHPETFSHTGQKPDGFHGSLGARQLDTRVDVTLRIIGVQNRTALNDDFTVDFDRVLPCGLVDLAELDVGLCDGDAGADVEALFDLVRPNLRYEVAPWVERDDLLLVEPRGLGGDVHGGLRVRVRGLVRRGERAEGDCEGTVDRVGARVGANRVAHLDHVRQTRGDDWTARFGVLCTPLERVWLDSCLVGVCCATEGTLDGGTWNELL